MNSLHQCRLVIAGECWIRFARTLGRSSNEEFESWLDCAYTTNSSSYYGIHNPMDCLNREEVMHWFLLGFEGKVIEERLLISCE